MDPLSSFAAPTRQWFADSFPAPTRVQALGWPLLADGRHALLLAPTGSGKTLAAFLACLDRLSRVTTEPETRGVRVVYVSPLKALVADIERNLRAPLVGLANAASRLGLPSRAVSVAVRTGDTPARERRLLTREPADILVTTPESLYLMLGSSARDALRTVETVIVDEIHAVAATKRGVHLALTLERLSALTGREPQRIGLSATQRPLEEIARFLGGDRPVEIVDAGEVPRMDLEVVVPIPDMENPVGSDGIDGNEGQRQEIGRKRTPGSPDRKKLSGIWPALYPELLALVRKQRSTLIFVNSRLSCERIAGRLNELAGAEIALAHHGSISHAQRSAIEERLKEGRIPAIVASSSLELGIDMGFVDLVILVESPGSVARGLQRLGRAGHGVGQTSVGRMFPKFRGDLLESVVVASRMRVGDIESTRVPQNCLDVLAQQVVAAVAIDPWRLDDLLTLIRRSWPYRDLTRGVFESVLDMLSGRWPSDEFRDLTPRIVWDRGSDTLSERRGARMLALLNAGTIPDRGLYAVQLGAEGPRLGELDEEMVFETRRGDRIILGASTWRIEEIRRDRVIVSPAPGEPGRLPFWHGDRPGRPIELGRAIGAVARELGALPDAAARARLADWHVHGFAADNLLNYLREQLAATEVLPSDQTVVVESFRDELGDWRVCILSPYGSRVHAPWAMAIEAALGPRGDTQVLWTDDGIALRLADVEGVPGLDTLIPDPDEVEERVLGQVRHSALFATRFRENAGRALLLPKRRPGTRSPLWAQRLKAQNLLTVVSQHPSFPLVLETWREILRDVFDLPALIEILRAIRSRAIRVHEVETPAASPFARNLVFAWVAAYMYEQDTPTAERRAAALSLDRGLLRELLGGDELASLLDVAAITAVEDELAGRAPDRKARHADGLHDLLRRVGDLSTGDLAACCEGPGFIRELERARRAVPVRIAGEERWIAVEDAGRYHEALATILPAGIPAVFLEAGAEPLHGLALRWARAHGPFSTERLVERWALPRAVIAGVLEDLARRGVLLRGRFRPDHAAEQWCEASVLRRLRQRAIAALRDEIAPVEKEGFARFLLDWHGIGARRGGPARLGEVVAQLEGVPMSYQVLVERVLPARVPDFQPRWLDDLGASGALVWVGAGAFGPKDGRIALYRRERISLLLDPPAWPDGWAGQPAEELRKQIVDRLTRRGASFLAELGPPSSALTAALWDLVWAGIVTNDTFGPLRTLGTRKGQLAAGGRWSLVAGWIEAVNPTTRSHARATGLLERFGLAAPPLASELPGGFAAVYDVLRAMEDGGRVRRGWFVDGLGGLQFALPGVVDRLRDFREAGGTAVVIAATDPANPWGAAFDWPDVPAGAPRPRRVVGAEVVLIGGVPVLFVEKGARSLTVFDSDRFDPAVRAWMALRRRARLDKVNGEAAAESAFAGALRTVGFVVGYDAMEWSG